MADNDRSLVSRGADQFLSDVARHPPARTNADRARLVFSMDATLSRQPTWDQAMQLQGDMFESTRALGGLSVQLCYFRGFNEFHASPWCDDPARLRTEMSSVACRGGFTQIARLLRHIADHATDARAAVFVGDAMEENADELCHLAGQLGLRNVKLFVFQEGSDPSVAQTFTQMASLSGGAYAPFDANSASQLRDLLSAAAVYAAGGKAALSRLIQSSEIKRLTQQVR